MKKERYKCIIDYDGTDFFGWQKQAGGVRTVQSDIESTLSKLLREQVEVTGCGRTDSGVHARGYAFHFDASIDEADLSYILYKMNKILDRDVVVHELSLVDSDFHTRFLATSRSYLYKMYTGKRPFEDAFSFEYPYKASDLDLNKLNEAAAILIGKMDFTPFCKTGSDVGTHICAVRTSYWESNEFGLHYHITADRFLRGMIRLIVGMCINVSRGKLKTGEVEEALKNQERLTLDWSVPAKGLTLLDIEY